jgi:hypothetical protein
MSVSQSWVSGQEKEPRLWNPTFTLDPQPKEQFVDFNALLSRMASTSTSLFTKDLILTLLLAASQRISYSEN